MNMEVWETSLTIALIFIVVINENTCCGIANQMEKRWMCAKFEKYSNNSQRLKVTSCKIQLSNNDSIKNQREGFQCVEVQEVRGQFREVSQSNYDQFNQGNALIDNDPSSCARMEMGTNQIFDIHLKRQQAIYAVQVFTNLGAYENGQHPKLRVGHKPCDLCLANNDQGSHWTYICPKSPSDKIILVSDERTHPEIFQLCTIKMFSRIDEGLSATENCLLFEPGFLNVFIGLGFGAIVIIIIVIIFIVIIILVRKKYRNKQEEKSHVSFHNCLSTLWRAPVASPRTLPNRGQSPDCGSNQTTDYDYVRRRTIDRQHTYEAILEIQPTYLTILHSEEATYHDASSTEMK